MIRIDEIRALHHDLHMRPFEADRRVYLLLDAHRMNDEAAAALLKDLEEPPAYATLVLVADELGQLPETIRSRCQLVPFRRLSRAAVESWIAAARAGARRRRRSPCSAGSPAAGSTARRGSSTTKARARRRGAPGCRARRLRGRGLRPLGGRAVILDGAALLGGPPRASASRSSSTTLDLPAREAEQRVRRAEFGAERAELLASLDDLAGVVPRPRRGRRGRRGGRRPRRPARRAPRGRCRRCRAKARRRRPRSSVRRGARSRSSTSTCRSSSRRCSSSVRRAFA